MWGPWFGVTVGGLLVVLLLIAIAFGTSALLIPVLIVAGVLAVLGVLYMLGSDLRRKPGEPPPDPVREAAPAGNEAHSPQRSSEPAAQ
jgi:hypothetical protein